MKKNFLISLLLLTGVYSTAFAETGEELFDQKCAFCHIKTKPTPEMRSSFVAPPAMGVMFNVKQAFNGDKEKTIAFIVDYAFNPSKEKAKCLDKSIQRFGLMPSQKDLVSEEELTKIAKYMYENFPKKDFEPKHEGN